MTTTAKKSHVWERDEHDWYVEPPRATAALLMKERFTGGVWDPCCGGGNIPGVLDDAGIPIVGTDIVQRITGAPAWWRGVRDFLGPDETALAPNIVMNPPFFRAAGAEAFIRRALAMAEAKVAAFVDVRFIAGGKRATGLFSDHPPARIWIITPRVSCPPGSYLAAGGKAGNGSSDWCWLVWDKTSQHHATQFGWLRGAS